MEQQVNLLMLNLLGKWMKKSWYHQGKAFDVINETAKELALETKAANIHISDVFTEKHQEFLPLQRNIIVQQ